MRPNRCDVPGETGGDGADGGIVCCLKHEYTKKLLAAIPNRTRHWSGRGGAAVDAEKIQSNICASEMAGRPQTLQRTVRVWNLNRLVRTILVLLFSVFVLSTTVFFVSRMAPGDPLVSYYGDRVERMSRKNEAGQRKNLDWMMELRFSMCAG